MPDKKRPIRTCIACRVAGGKKDFVRLVKTPEGSIRVDLTGKQSGRGAYLCPTKECIAIALKKKSIERGLKARVPEQVIEELRNLVEEYDDDVQGAQTVGYDGSK